MHFVCFFFINSSIELFQPCWLKLSDVLCFIIFLAVFVLFLLEWTSLSVLSGVSGADLFKKLLSLKLSSTETKTSWICLNRKSTNKHVWYHESAIMLYSRTCNEFNDGTLCNESNTRCKQNDVIFMLLPVRATYFLGHLSYQIWKGLLITTYISKESR